MKKQIKKTIAILLIVCFALSITAAAVSESAGDPNAGVVETESKPIGDPNSYVVPVDSKFHGDTYGDWSVTWWKWAESIPVSHNPLSDVTGENGDEGQSGSVWFLAGTSIDTKGTTGVSRTVEIPEGKALFFPVVNAVNTPLPYDPIALRQALTKYIDGVKPKDLEVTVDNYPLKKLKNFRVGSRFFVFTDFPPLPADSLLKFSGVTIKDRIAVSDGYWIMLKPLPVGKHTIIIHGKIGSAFETQVTYKIKIKPKKH
jgi:hypothetical protein